MPRVVDSKPSIFKMPMSLYTFREPFPMLALSNGVGMPVVHAWGERVLFRHAEPGESHWTIDLYVVRSDEASFKVTEPRHLAVHRDHVAAVSVADLAPLRDHLPPLP